MKPLIIGIAGGSGSGKSTVARNVAELLTTTSVAFIDMDAYYKNFPDLSLDERKKLNWDHPDAFDYDLLCSHLEALSKRKPIEKPEYDFVTHLRRAERTRVEPADVVVIDGILLFVDARVRERRAERDRAARRDRVRRQLRCRVAGHRRVDDEDRKRRRNGQRDDEPGGTAPHGAKNTAPASGLALDRRGAPSRDPVAVIVAQGTRRVLGERVAVALAVGRPHEGGDDVEIPFRDVPGLAPQVGKAQVDVQFE